MQKKIVSSVSSQILYILVATIVGLAAVPITISMLGKLEYGAFELVLSLVLIDLFLEFGLGSTLVKYIPEYKDDKQHLKSFVWSYFYIKLFLTFLGFCVVMLVGYNFESIFNVDELTNIEEIKLATYIFAMSLFIKSAATFLDAFLKGFVYFGMVNISKVFSTILFFVIFYIYYKIFDIYSIVDIAIIWFIIRPIILIVLLTVNTYYLRLSYILKPVRFNIKDIKSTIRYMFGMTYIVMIAQLYNRLPKVIIGIVLSPVYVAYWAIMEKIKDPLQQLQDSFLRPLIPILSEKDNFTKMSEQKILQAVRLQYLFMSFWGVMTISHIDLFINLWLGSGYIEVIALVKIILLSYLFPKAGVFLMMYYAKGKTKINSIFVTSNTIVSLIVGTFVLLLTKDIKLFSWSFSIILIVMSLVNILRYTKFFDISNKIFIKDTVMQPILIVVSFLILHNLLYQYISFDLIGLISSIFMSLIIYGVLFFIFMKEEDKRIVSKIINRKKDS